MDKREELIRLIKILPQDRLDEIIDSVKTIINEIDKDDINMRNVTRKGNDNEIFPKDSNVNISKEAENADKKEGVEEMLVQSNRPPCPRCGCKSVVRNGKSMEIKDIGATNANQPTQVHTIQLLIGLSLVKMNGKR